MTAKLKAFAINSLIVVVATVLAYVLVEVVFFRLLLPNMRFNVLPFLPETPGVLVQTSKADYAPRNFVAIMGNSYAEGVGDEMLEVNGNDAKSFHAAHVIHDLTGRDVVTFRHGRPARPEAFVQLPTLAIQ